MPFDNLLTLSKAIIASIELGSNSLSDETLSNLRAIFPEKLVIGALDLIDRDNVIYYDTGWGHSEYEVLGSTSNNSVFVDLHAAEISYSCTCPAFVYSVLITNTHIMCKHVLAVMIGERLGLCVQRPTNADDLAAIYHRQYPAFEEPEVMVET